ncbi:DUF2540 domain-containing protein [Methanococcus maripaludis]|uniref:Uncharacterized protein n=1 Tax=Methanococcus maripaludis TaxID=39152 RepID=A0A8T4H2J2_METMI|nr:DUF2540 domain-containing protein [Methanococcus maripaludis]MBM7408801.1 hypothetical protein [Methanococcus maripaludis]MBP2219030.1 hypothetical protein [Methanococcus maripaludis]
MDNDRFSLGLVSKLDRRSIHYVLHKLEDIGPIPPAVLSQAVEAKKKYRTMVKVADIEKRIIDKYGVKTTQVLMNSYIIMNKDDFIEIRE